VGLHAIAIRLVLDRLIASADPDGDCRQIIMQIAMIVERPSPKSWNINQIAGG
jgi:hypothetical protein